jgi:hypothetical protein
MLHSQTFFYLSLEVPGGRPPSRFPIWAPIQRDAHHQGLESNAPSPKHAFTRLSKAREGAPHLVPQQGPHGKRCPFLEPSYIQFIHSRGKQYGHHCEAPCGWKAYIWWYLKMADWQQTRQERHRRCSQFYDDYRNWEYKYKHIIVHSVALLNMTLCLFYQRIIETIKCRKGDINLILPLIPELTYHIHINKHK